MNGLKGHALVATLLLAGCASAPEQTAENQGVAEPSESYASAAGENLVPNQVVDLNAVVDDSASTVICREHLKQGSNVIVQTCMTRANWEKFKRFQARDAQEIVRMLQGSAYR